MDVLSAHSVVLPDANIVTASPDEQPWWTTQDGSGYINPNILSPDPDQPRRHMNKDRLAELEASVAERGVRESITITPLSHTPWARSAPGHEDAFFIIVGGHRRCAAACKADIKAVPVKVKLYKTEMEHRLDVSLLNKGRDDLEPLDEGHEFVSLREIGWTIDQLCKSFGHSAPYVYSRMNLTKLHPDIQAKLDPAIPEKQRLPSTLAGILGGVKSPSPDELAQLQDTFSKYVEAAGIQVLDCDEIEENERRYMLQKTLLAVIEGRSLNSIRATAFIREQTLTMPSHQGRGGRKPQRFRADKRRDIVTNFIGSITGSVLMDWKPAEFRKAFELAPREELEGLIKRLEEAHNSVAGFIRILELIKNEKKPTHPKALEIQEQRRLAGGK